MRSLFAAAEMFPYAKTGGLADMAAALPKALREWMEVDAVTPWYRFSPIKETKETERFEVHFDRSYEVRILRRDDTLFVYNELLSEVDRPYGYPNDWLRFAIFSKAVAHLSCAYHILHLNDWHTALAAIWSPTKTLFTIHNLAYQGIFEAKVVETLRLEQYFHMDGIEFYRNVNFLKAGIAYTNAITTVSPTYAREILHPEFGCGLEGFLRKHRHKLIGILNGIDYRLYDPSSDPLIPYHYSVQSILFKKAHRRLFFESERPLFIFIGRFVEQKGIDLILQNLPKLAKLPLNLYILGEGERRFEQQLHAFTSDNVKTYFGYDELLSHRLYAAADFLLMPSRFEPCGLNQMIAMRYGTVPIVRPVGGLRDTVHPLKSRRCGEGVRIEAEERFLETIQNALDLYDTQTYKSAQFFDMECDFSIAKTAKEYHALYQRLG